MSNNLSGALAPCPVRHGAAALAYPCNPANPAGAEESRDLLSTYLIDLLNNQYQVATVMERMNILHDWRAFAMSEELDELYYFLDQWTAPEERRRRFVAVRSFTRWLAERGHIANDWTLRADLARVAGEGARR